MKSAILSLLIISVFVTVVALSSSTRVQNRANDPILTTGGPSLKVSSSNGTDIPTSSTISLPVPANKKITFLSVIIKFDPAILRLSAEPKISPNFKNILNLTPAHQSNTTGIISASLGADPDASPVSPSPANLDILSLSLDMKTGATAPPSGTTITYGAQGSYFVTNPDLTKKPIPPTKITYTSFEVKPKEYVNLGLILSAKKDQNGRPYLHATWKEHSAAVFSFGVRSSTTGNLVPGSRVTDLIASSYDITDFTNYAADKYFFNLSAKLGSEVDVQTPRKYFSIDSKKNLTINN